MGQGQQQKLMVELGRRVRAHREELGVSQETLGERADLHRTYIGRIERGQVNPSLANLVRLADGLEMDLGDLVRGIKDATASRRRGRG